MTRASSNARAQGRFIPSEDLGEVVQWQFGAVGGDVSANAVLEAPEPISPEDQQPDAELQQALEQAFEEGKAQGQAQAALEWQHKLDDYISGEGAAAAQRWATLTSQFELGLKEAQRSMAQDVLSLASEVARQVVRRELTADHNPLQPVIAEALNELAAAGRVTTVRLHPQDEEAMGEALRHAFADASLQWKADGTLQPGGCELESSGKIIDAGLPKRWQRALAPLGLESPWTDEAPDGAD